MLAWYMHGQSYISRGSCHRVAVFVLTQAYRAELAPAVVSMLAAASEACPAGAPARMATTHNGTVSSAGAIPAAVLHKEAIYAAVGTGAYELHDFIDFQPWLRTTLVQASLSDTSLSDTSLSDTSLFDTSQSETSQSETSLCETSLSDTSLSDTSLSDVIGSPVAALFWWCMVTIIAEKGEMLAVLMCSVGMSLH